MSLQIIHSIDGKAEYVLLPIHTYQQLKNQIDAVMQSADYEPFIVEDYVTNPVALARIKANLTQQELADRMRVSQAYISQLEARNEVSARTLEKVKRALN